MTVVADKHPDLAKIYWAEMVDNLEHFAELVDQRLAIVNDIYDAACRGARKFSDFKFAAAIHASAEEARRLAAVRIDIRRRMAAAAEKI